MNIRKLLLTTALVGALAAPAAAQVNYVPQVGVNTANLRVNTYTATMLKMVPEGTSATDFFCISGAAGKNVHIRRIELEGTGTLASVVVYLVHRVSLDTGTTATSTYIPGNAKLRSTNPTPAATVVGYNSTSGNPTIVDTSPTYIRSGAFIIGASGTASPNIDRLVWNFGTSVDAYNQGADIPSGNTAEQYCLNLASQSITAVFEGSIEWTED